MNTKRHKSYLIIAALLCLIGIFGILTIRNRTTGSTQDPLTLNVSLYKYIPDYNAFEKIVSECWKEKHPEVELNFTDWDCYSKEVPDDLDVFVFDTLSLDAFAGKGCLLALSREDIQDYDDLIPSFMEGCRVIDEICAVPQFLCTDLLYTRKEDAALKNVDSIYALYSALAERELLTEKESAFSKATMYLQALTDEKQQYLDQYPPIEAGKLSAKAQQSLEMVASMRQEDPNGVPEDGDSYFYAKKFAAGEGRAYIGYSESMNAMGDSASDMDFRLFSMTDDNNIPLFYVDAAAVNAKISEEKRALALDFLNMITSKDTLARASIHDGKPLYLLTARYSIYDALASEYPIYKELKSVATVPDAFVFRIKPDGDAYIEEAEQSAAGGLYRN